MKDIIKVALAYNKEVRVVACSLHYTIKRAIEIHKVNSEDFKKFLTSTLLYSQNFKGDEIIITKIESKEVEMSALVDKKARIKADIELMSSESIKEGLFRVIRDDNGKMFDSSVLIGSPNVDDIFTEYFIFSEQIYSVLKVYADDRFYTKGFLVQLLPGASKETTSKLKEVFYCDIDSKSIDTILGSICDDNYEVVNTIYPKYYCDCSKKKYKNKISTLSKDELKKLLIEDKEIKIICPFCHKTYIFDENDIELIINKKN